MGNKSTRSKISSLRQRVAEHEAKILTEKQKPYPDHGMITHWQHEIDAFTQHALRLERRLQQRRRRGK